MFITSGARRVILFLSVIFLSVSAAMASGNRLEISFKHSRSNFPLSEATVVFDPGSPSLCRKVAGLFAADIERVTGRAVKVDSVVRDKNVVIIATAGESPMLDRLQASGKIDLKGIDGEWERFVIKTVDKPMAGVDRALVIAGSDRRGAAYGAFTVSERMGVSPFFWWTDVPVPSHDKVSVKADYVSESPTVKYRGIFINDEDWGLTPWASKNYEKELGNVGPNTYAAVCELILRLKGNMLAPAMHTCTDAFYKNPDNKVAADAYGIMITTSHCEPLLFNNASPWEWERRRDGEWNYATNKDVIYGKLDARVREAAPYDNIYTLAMRGLHDEGMRGDFTPQERVKVLRNAIMDQREIISNHVKGKSLTEIPQIFVPYKEALTIYNDGLEVPDDVTLVWPDDNYGYIKRLSNEQEQKRSGHSGVYYHVSYLGVPHDYLWICTTPPALMYEQLKRAYDTGADRYWLLNVGDIKPAELALTTFFGMAWDLGKYNLKNINDWQPDFLASIYGHRYRDELRDILDEYYRLAWSRKPEAMGWEREWEAPELDDLRDTDFSFANYNDALRRLKDYENISTRVNDLMNRLPQEYVPSFYEMVAYPVMGACQMNRKFLMAQLNHELAAAGDKSHARWAAIQSTEAYDSIAALTKRYNTQLDGKWNYMMDVAPALCSKVHLMPPLTVDKSVEPVPYDLSPKPYELEGCMVVDPVKCIAVTDENHTATAVEGLGYDYRVMQMGDAMEPRCNPSDLTGNRLEYILPAIDADSVTVMVYALPFFPLHTGVGTSFGISMDSAPAVKADYIPVEQSKIWRDNVIRNGVIHKATFPVDRKSRHHKLILSYGDAGAMIERIVLDWGGLKPTYVGPALPRKK